MSIVAGWTTWSGGGAEECRVAIGYTRIGVEADVVPPPEESPSVRYALACDASWRVRRAAIEMVGSGGSVVLVANGEGRWTDGEGMPLDALTGAIDIDIAVTPFTNTLPIRRLGLGIGEEAVIDVAYVEPPSLAVARRPQLYRRIAESVYLFRSLDHDFEAEIGVDRDGLVTDYPGLFRRVV